MSNMSELKNMHITAIYYYHINMDKEYFKGVDQV